MNRNKSFFGLFLAFLVLLPGCILRVPSYHKQRLKLVRDNCTYSAVEKGITLQAKLLTKLDKEDLFGEHVGHLEGNDVKVIYLSMYNLSDKDYFFASDCIDLKQLSSKKVVKSMKKTSSIGRFILSDIIASCNPLQFMDRNNPLFIPVAIFVSPIFVVTSLIGFVQGIKSVVVNTRVRKDIEGKIVSEKIIIRSGDHYEGLMFIESSDYVPCFPVVMHDSKSTDNYVTFNVDLRSDHVGVYDDKIL